MDGIDDDGGLGGSEGGHFKGEVSEAIGAGDGGFVERGGGAFDFGGSGGPGEWSAGGVFDEDHEFGVLAFEPGSRIGEFEEQGMGGRARRGNLRSWSRRRSKNESAGAHFFEDRAVLRVEAKFQGGFLVRVERKQIEVVVDETMEHAATAIDGGLEKSIVRAAIFGLHVIDGAVEVDVGIVAEDHRDIFGNSAPNLRRAGADYLFPRI